MEDRRIHIKKVDGFSLYMLDDMPVEESIAIIQNLIEVFKSENNEYTWHDFKFIIEYEYDYGEAITLSIEAYRYWTDEEIAEEEKRIKEREEEIQSQKEAKERKEYERLKKKFGG